QIRRLQIAMYDSLLMQIPERIADLQTVLDRQFPRKPTSLFQSRLERPAGNQLHDQEPLLALPPAAEVFHDLRVLQLLEDVDFTFEPRDELRVRSQLRRKHLERDLAARFRVDGSVHGSHAAD